MSDHIVRWDHSDCDHTDPEDSDYWCHPHGEVRCVAIVYPQHASCRVGCEHCEEYATCEPFSDGSSPCEPDHPAVPHCTNGHPLVVFDYCNAELFLNDDELNDNFGGPPWGSWEYRGGPINVWWRDYGYEWEYA